MSNTVKIILILGLALLIGVGGCIGIAYVWFAANKDDLMAMGGESKKLGEELATTTDQNGCLDEVMRRNAACDGLLCEVQNGLVLSACLENAAESPGLCEGVPRENDMLDTVAWRLRTCATAPDKNKERCGRLVAAWQRHCHPPYGGAAEAAPNE